MHCWLVSRRAHEAASDYLYRGIEETGISDTDFRVLEVLIHKGPLPVNTIGPKVHLPPVPSVWRSIARIADSPSRLPLGIPEDAGSTAAAR